MSKDKDVPTVGAEVYEAQKRQLDSSGREPKSSPTPAPLKNISLEDLLGSLWATAYNRGLDYHEGIYYSLNDNKKIIDEFMVKIQASRSQIAIEAEKKYDQLIQGGKGTMGDCFRACVATVLQSDPETLPNYHDSSWYMEWEGWLNNVGLDIQLSSGWHGANGLWIASVKSQNYPDTTHAIVMKDADLYHDPSPKKKFKSIDTDQVLTSYHILVADMNKLLIYKATSATLTKGDTK